MIPTISGTVGGQTVGAGNNIDPFASVTTADLNGDAVDSMQISLLNSNGQATDANGKLVLNGNVQNITFDETSAGTYQLVDHSAVQNPSSTAPINEALGKLQFISSGGDGTTTTFALRLGDTYMENFANDSTTTVTVGGTNGLPPTTSPPTTASPPPSDTTTTSSPPPSDTTTTSNNPPTSDTTTSSTNPPPSDTTTTSNNPPTSDTTTTSNNPPTSDTPPIIHETGVVYKGQVDSLTTGDGELQIDHPDSFHGQVDFLSGNIDLAGLAAADGYSFKNDMLTLYACGKPIDHLCLTSDSTSAFTVQNNGSTVSVYTADDVNHPTGGTILHSI